MLRRVLGKSLTLAKHPATALKSRVLLPLCLKLGRPRNYQRCGFVCKQPWNRDFVRHYRRARRFRENVELENVDVIRILSYSRSGSHNFFSRLHYLPSCFVLKENLCPTGGGDPMWLSLKPENVTSVDYMGFSLFGLHGLQQKRGGDLRHLVAPFNKLLEFPLNQQRNPIPAGDKVLLLIRNFFRVLMSRQDAVQKHGKEKWVIDDDMFYASISAHYNNVKSYVSMMAEHPDRFFLVGHEVFCARPRQVFRETTEKLGIGDGAWCEPGDFFTECIDGKARPVIRDGVFWDAAVEAPILGTGGNYNPNTTPSLERTLSGNIDAFMKKEWVEHAQRLFGKRLVELWLSDTPATYRSMSADEYTQLLYEG